MKKAKKILVISLIVVAAITVGFLAIGFISLALHPEETPAPAAVTTEAPAAAPVNSPAAVEGTQAPRENPLDGIPLSAEQKRAVYDEAEAALYAVAVANPDLVGDEMRAKEDAALAEIAARYGVSVEDVTQIYLQATFGYLFDLDPASFSIPYGELVDVTITGTSLVLKAKISPSYSNKATIDQNYYNVCRVIQEQGGSQFSKISYWAVADMTDGSEGKVISFTVGKDLIARIAAGNFADNTLGDYLTDLWVLPSLLN